jgi:hypothetical protein
MIEYDVPMEMLLHSLQRAVPARPVSEIRAKSGIVRVCGRIVSQCGGGAERHLQSFHAMRGKCVCLDVQLIIETSYMAAVVPLPETYSLSDTSDEDDSDADMNDPFDDTPVQGSEIDESEGIPPPPQVLEGRNNAPGPEMIQTSDPAGNSAGKGISDTVPDQVVGELDDDDDNALDENVSLPPLGPPRGPAPGVAEHQTFFERIPDFDSLPEALHVRSDFWVEQGGKKILVRCNTEQHSLIVDMRRQREMYGDPHIEGRAKRTIKSQDGKWMHHDAVIVGGLSRGGAMVVGQRAKTLIQESIDPALFPEMLKTRIEQESEELAKNYFSGASFGYNHAELCVDDIVHVIGMLSEEYHATSGARVLVLKPFSERQLLRQIKHRSSGVCHFGKQGADHALIHLLQEEFQSPKLVISTLDNNGEEWKMPNVKKGEHLNGAGIIVSPHDERKVVSRCALVGESKDELDANFVETESHRSNVTSPSNTKILPSTIETRYHGEF